MAIAMLTYAYSHTNDWRFAINQGKEAKEISGCSMHIIPLWTLMICKIEKQKWKCWKTPGTNQVQ